MLANYYEELAKKEDVRTLVRLGRFDERIYEVIVRHKLMPKVLDQLPDATTARFLAKGMAYQPVADPVIRGKFVKICSFLSRYETAAEGAALAELVGNCGLPEKYRLELFNFSETYRHMALTHSPFAQRGVLRLLSYIFVDDFMSDAVANLQYKSDILNHINRIFIKTPDFVSWRFSVRVMSIAGGYNEERLDVDKTERMTVFATKAVPEFFTYFLVGFVYARFRHYPQRVQGIVPKWLARHRALFSGFVCGALGLYFNTVTDWQQYRHRLKYEFRHSQEMRRRRGAERRGIEYRENNYFDSLEGVTRHIFVMQCKAYMVTAGILAFTLMPLPRINFPKFMGDVPFRFPYVPRFFPMLLGMHCASRCAVPFVFAPFCAVTAYFKGADITPYDQYVHFRYWMWKEENKMELYDAE